MLVQNIFDLLQNSSFSDLLDVVGAIKDAGNHSINKLLQLYDDLGTAIWINRVAVKPLIDALLQEPLCDKVWFFYLLNVSDTALARPDEYSYSRNFIHAPFWIAILYTKIGAVPPPAVSFLLILGR